MQIGEIARKAGTSARTVRYYEELGLIQPDSHSSGGFRLYSEDNLKRLRVISFLKELGLSLSEIREIFAAKKASGADKETIRTLLRIFGDKLRLVDSRIESLSRIRAELTRAMRILHSCESCDRAVLLDALVCADCSSLMPRDEVPDTLEVMLH